MRDGVHIELLAVKDGWRWTLTDRLGTTQGWEPNIEGAALQAHHCLLAHGAREPEQP